MQSQGYEITQGYFRLDTQADCVYTYEEMGTCYGNNPAAPYVGYAVRPWPDEFVDPATKLALGPVEEGYITSFRFDPREAIVVIGVLPPPAAYFGIQSYLFTRQGTYATASLPYWFISTYLPNMLNTFFAPVPHNDQRIEMFASLSNSLNNVVIERQSGAAFDQARVFIITPDQRMDQVVRKALSRLAIPEKDIFTEPIPGDLRIGLGEASDDFATIIRYAMPDDGGAPGTPSDNWRKTLPLAIFRIRDTSPGRPAQTYPPVDLETRTAASELYLQDDLDSLARLVSQRWGQTCADASCSNLAQPLLRLQLPPIDLVGPLCTEIGMNCLADTQDTAYQVSKSLTVSPDVVYAVAGTLGTQTGNATYVGLGLNATMKQFGLQNFSEHDLAGTASAYASQVQNTDKFFLYYFTRDCRGLDELTDGHCYAISETELPPCTDPTSATCDNLSFSIRDYIRPGIQRGPTALLKLPALVITLPHP